MRAEPPTGAAGWDRRRGDRRRDRSGIAPGAGRRGGEVGWAGATAGGAWPPGHSVFASATDWVIVESADGATREIAEQAKFLASAWLATRGFDLSTVPPADIRAEVTTDGDGVSTTRVLVRAAVLQTARRRR